MCLSSQNLAVAVACTRPYQITARNVAHSGAPAVGTAVLASVALHVAITAINQAAKTPTEHATLCVNEPSRLVDAIRIPNGPEFLCSEKEARIVECIGIKSNSHHDYVVNKYRDAEYHSEWSDRQILVRHKFDTIADRYTIDDDCKIEWKEFTVCTGQV